MRLFIIFTLCYIALGVNAKNVRLTNNDLAREGEFPYQVSLQYNGGHFCGGTLISNRHVLTAAHCVTNFFNKQWPAEAMSVVVGTINTAAGTRIGIAKIGRHPNFEPLYLFNDVSVITLASPITESATVKIIGLPSPMQELPARTQLIVSGFGAGYTNGPGSPVLKKMNMYVVDQQTCQTHFNMVPGQLCAALSPGNGVCQGDSGGPLTLSNKQVVVGVVSATSTSGCGTGNPDLFAKVSHYIDYIRSEMAA